MRERLTRRDMLLAGGAAAMSQFAFRFERAESQSAAIRNVPAPVRDPAAYTAYIPTASKTGPFYIYTCEFDAAWAIMTTFGVEASLDEQLAAIAIDRRREPWYEWRSDGVYIFGGDITTSYSGDFTSNFLCRTTWRGMSPVFESFGFKVSRVSTRSRIERFLRRGRLIWIKTTVDFRDWTPATWITPEGNQLPVVLSNDHAMVIIGYNDEVVVMRDVLGPTDTNWERPYEFEVSWDRFLACWGAQGNDGLAVAPAG